jgi:peptide/nickel transport system ATP-binding protein
MSTAPDTRSDGTVIECRALARTFGVRRSAFGRKTLLKAVQDVDLTIARGDVLAIVGESGCGKSTLARLMLGILAPSAGTVAFEGRPIATFERKSLGRRVQPVFQDPYTSLNPRKTIAQIVGLPLSVHGLGNRAERRARVLELLELCGLRPTLAHAYPSQLSGGQRQRVAIARALAAAPRVLICDEPTSALDVSVQAQILTLLERLKGELDLTYVLISHNLSVVEHIANRVAVMYLGQIVELGPTSDVFAAPRHPYTQALLRADLRPEPGQRLRHTNLLGTFPDPLDPPAGCAFHPRCGQALPQCRDRRPASTDADGVRVACWLHERPR